MLTRSIARLLVVVGVLLGTLAAPSGAQARPAVADDVVTVVNSDSTGQVSRYDVAGNALDAHDGSMIQVGSTFYLYGTSYACGYKYQQNSSFCGFKVYSSPDLVHWTDRGYVVAPGACGYCFRPHVVYNASTGMYVLWSDAGGRYLVATSPSPTGLFTEKPTPQLAVGGAVDMALFVDTDGTGYVVHNTTLVEPGLTADMVVEKLTADYLSTTGEFVRLGLGDVEAFAVFKRNGVYHALMSDPSCAYCAGATGEMTAPSMLGPWSGAWYDPNGVHQSGRAEPRWRARLVNPNNCGGQPLKVLPLQGPDGQTTFYFVSDRWNNRAPNESLANLFIGPLSFDASGKLQDIECTNSFPLTPPGPRGGYDISPDQDQSSGFDGFHHYCDVAGQIQRQQTFVPSRNGQLTVASVTTFQNGNPNAALTFEVVDAGSNEVLSRTDFPVGSVPWAPTALKAYPGIAVTAGKTYALRLSSATTSGCYGWEYSNNNPYAAGQEAYSTTGGTTFVVEAGRDLKFTTDVGTSPTYREPAVPAGFTRCAGEGERCSFTGTRKVLYGAGTASASYRAKVAAGGVDCKIVAFGADPALNVLKSCYVSPPGGPSGSTRCVTEGQTCAVGGPAIVTFGAAGNYADKLVGAGSITCTNASFGRDPLPGVEKACYVASAGSPPGLASCAAENQTCTVAGPRTAVFGARGAFYSRLVNGPFTCNAATFGADPIYGVLKTCALV
ncbi:family 43 glycosylhydrolase [Kribbella antibiotica]|uniref:family 43 glycosylhydrolase n=1 Tax=Kribbella antibiotica TaxID=190195 RepID=UPI0014051EAD|nr:family 43 glycosylhydrolase [Kribbella antibiotica]